MSTQGIASRFSQWLKGKRTVVREQSIDYPPVSSLTHAQRDDIIHAHMIRAGLYASRNLGPAVGSSLLSIAGREGGGDGLAPGAAVRQGHFLASDKTDGEGSDLE